MREFHSNWWGGKDDRLALEGREEYWVREPCSFDCRLCFGGLCYCIECKQDCGGDIFRWLTMGVGRGCDGMKWWVEGCSQQCDVDEDRGGLLAAVEGCYGYSG